MPPTSAPIFSARVSAPFRAWLLDELPAPSWDFQLAWRVLDRDAERLVIRTSDEATDILAHLDRLAARRVPGHMPGVRRFYAARMAKRLRGICH